MLHWWFSKDKQSADQARRIRKSFPERPPLFHRDPGENFRLWMHICFPGVPLAREDAIREWLAKPLEARVQGGSNHRDRTNVTHGSTPEPATVTNQRQEDKIVGIKPGSTMQMTVESLPISSETVKPYGTFL